MRSSLIVLKSHTSQQWISLRTIRLMDLDFIPPVVLHEKCCHLRKGGSLRWTVSQAVPLRQADAHPDIFETVRLGWASGTVVVVANVDVDGYMYFGRHHQWLTKNVDLEDEAVGGTWSLVYVGCTRNVPQESNSTKDDPSISIENKHKI